MAHERKLLRDAVTAQLIAAATSVGARVFPSRLGPLQSTQLPAICVYVEEEFSETKGSAPRELTRSAKLAIEAWVAVPADNNLDDAFDDLALEIEEVMDVDPWHDANAAGEGSVLVGTEYGATMTGQRPMGCVKLTYEVTYHTDLRVTAPVNDFDTADIRIEDIGTGPIHTDNQPHDLVENIHE